MHEIEQRIQEFESKIKNASEFKEKLKYYKLYAYFLSPIDSKKSYQIIEEAMKLAVDAKDEYERNWILFLKGNSLIELDKNDQALLALLEAKNYFYVNYNKEFYAKILSNIAVVYFNLKLYNQAIFIWKDLLINYVQHDDITFKNLVMNNLIAAYQNTFSISEITEFQIMEILNYYSHNNIKKNQTYCDALVNLATHYRLKGNIQKSIEVGLESLKLANMEGYNKLKCDICYNIYLNYKELNDNENKIYYLKMALNCSKKHHFLFLQVDIYRELYLYYKEMNSYKEAFEYLEKFHEEEALKREAQSNVNRILGSYDFEDQDQKNATYLVEYLKKNTFDLDRNIFLENMDGDIVKINIDSIVYAESYNKNLKICSPNGKVDEIKISFKDFTDIVYEKFKNNHLFFNTNLRKQMINLYWFKRFDRSTKQVFLNVIGEDLVFDVSRSQLGILKELLSFI